jgi:uncharacterized protein (TIGR00730 family)
MRSLSSICVYCASSTGTDPRFGEAADAVGALLAAEGIRLVYGGGSVGLMGRVADATMAAGGEVVGVIPRGLFQREVEHRGITELVEVESMHERKQRMFDLADAFVALPGGLGTLEELAEVTTWAQLGIHAKPIAALDLFGFWRPLLDWIDHATALGLVREKHRGLITAVDSVDGLLPALRSYRSEPVTTWLDLDET